MNRYTFVLRLNAARPGKGADSVDVVVCRRGHHAGELAAEVSREFDSPLIVAMIDEHGDPVPGHGAAMSLDSFVERRRQNAERAEYAAQSACHECGGEVGSGTHLKQQPDGTHKPVCGPCFKKGPDAKA